MENYQIIILFLDKDGFDLYTPTQESFIRFTFPQNIVQDMEVLNEDALVAQITVLLTNANIPPSTVVILISQSLLFVQDIQTVFPSEEENKPPKTLTGVEQQQKIQLFLDTVPFESIESKAFPLEDTIRIVATNKTIYDTIIIAFEKSGYIIKAVIPAFILGAANEGEGLNDEVIATVIKNNELLKQQSFTIPSQEIIPQTPEEKKKEFLSLPKQYAKLYTYGGVFIILLSILSIMYKIMLDQNASDRRTIPNPPLVARTQVISTPTAGIPVAAFVPSNNTLINKTKITIQIQINNTTQTQGQLIKNKLLGKGYSNVLLTTNTTTAAKTLILFSSIVDEQTQLDITNIISNIFTNFSTQQVSQPQFDITIIPSGNL